MAAGPGAAAAEAEPVVAEAVTAVATAEVTVAQPEWDMGQARALGIATTAIRSRPTAAIHTAHCPTTAKAKRLLSRLRIIPGRIGIPSPLRN
jgi:hypothetical protein